MKTSPKNPSPRPVDPARNLTAEMQGNDFLASGGFRVLKITHTQMLHS